MVFSLIIFVSENSYVSQKCNLLTCWVYYLKKNKPITIFEASQFSNTVNMNRYYPHKQKLLGVLNTFKSIK